MKNTKSLFIFASLILTVLLVSLSSATLQFTESSFSANANHNSQVTVTFTIQNTGSVDYNSLNWSESTTSVGSWVTLPTISALSAGGSATGSAVLSVPQYQTGSFNANLKVKNSTIADDSLPITITVSNTPSISISKVNSITKTSSGSVKVENTGNVNLNSIVLNSTGSFNVTFSDSSFALSPGQTKTVTVSSSDVNDTTIGTSSVTVTATDTSQSVSSSTTFSVLDSFCSNGDVGKLEITDFDITSDGDDEEEWKLLDTIKIEVEVENTGSDDIKEVFVEIGLFDSSGKNVIKDLDFISSDEEESEIGRINDDDSEVVEFEFRVPADFDDGDYKLVVKAYSDDLKEANSCADQVSDFTDDTYLDISVIREDDEGKYIAFEDVRVTPVQASCGETVLMSFDVYNIGDEDQDQVRINLENSELGISLSKEIRSSLDIGDSASMSFSFVVPSSAVDKVYSLNLDAEYDYRRDIYRERSDTRTSIPLTVLGCGNSGTTVGSFAAISASLSSEAKAGEQLVVKSLVTNTKSNSQSIILDASGFESWAELVSVSPRILTLASGESKEVVYTFNVNEDASGSQRFTINAQSGTELMTKDVVVALASSGSSIFAGNGLIWTIGIINLVLIILIIIVAIVLSRR